MKTIYNTDIPSSLWMARFRKDQLIYIAKSHGVAVGKNKGETADNLELGIPVRSSVANFKPIKFKMDLCVSYPD